jgi:hypothetical protein
MTPCSRERLFMDTYTHRGEEPGRSAQRASAMRAATAPALSPHTLEMSWGEGGGRGREGMHASQPTI